MPEQSEMDADFQAGAIPLVEQSNYEKALQDVTGWDYLPEGALPLLKHQEETQKSKRAGVYALLAIADELRALGGWLKKYPFPIIAPDGGVSYITLSDEACAIVEQMFAASDKPVE